MSNAVRRALWGALKSDVVGGGALGTLLGTVSPGYAYSVYHNNAPEDAPYPFIIFNKQAGTPTESFGSRFALAGATNPDALVEELWQVRAVDQYDSADRAEAIARRVAYLLDGTAVLSLANDPNTGRPCVPVYLHRTSDVEFAEVEGGKTYHYVGALYRVVWTTT